MVGRSTVCAVVAMLWCLPHNAWSQGYSPYQTMQAGYAPPMSAGAPSYAPAPQGAPGYAPAPTGAPGAPMIESAQPYPEFYGYSSNIPPQQHTHPFETGYYNMRQTEFGEVLSNAFTEAWFRGEYLFWNIDAPGSVLLGAPVEGVFDPRDPFVTTSPTGLAKVEDLSEITLWDNSGFRGTFGIPLTYGTLEIGGFVLGEKQSHFIPEEISPGVVTVSTSTLINGEVSDLLRGYDEFFSVNYTSKVWGMNANVVIDHAPQGEGVKHRPIAGLRFLNVRETLGQLGVSNAAPDFVTHIDADSSNNIYGVNLGFESVLEHRWFTIGVRPQVTLGLNSFRNRVSTEGFAFPGEARKEEELTGTGFSPVGELLLFARIPVSDNMSFTVGFTGMMIGNVERPGETIVYNTDADEDGTPTGANFHTRQSQDSMKVYGLTVGGEIIFK